MLNAECRCRWCRWDDGSLSRLIFDDEMLIVSRVARLCWTRCTSSNLESTSSSLMAGMSDLSRILARLKPNKITGWTNLIKLGNASTCLKFRNLQFSLLLLSFVCYFKLDWYIQCHPQLNTVPLGWVKKQKLGTWLRKELLLELTS